MLTLEQRGLPPGRLDQFSGSAAYSLFVPGRGGVLRTLSIGIGFRHAGRLYGERIQNGVHRLLRTDLKDIPYVDTHRTDGTLWIHANRDDTLGESLDLGFLGANWRTHLGLFGTTLVSTNGQWDGSGSILGVASRSWFHTWIGIQGDWRAGHDQDLVQSETAIAEAGGSLALGFRFGPFLAETTQNFDNRNASGRFSLMATGEDTFLDWKKNSRWGFQTGVMLPDVQIPFQIRYSLFSEAPETKDWRPTITLEGRYGQPQYADSPSEILESGMLTVGLELERALLPSSSLLDGYLGLATGWQHEQLLGAGELWQQESVPIDRGVLAIDVGTRILALTDRDRFSFKIQTGLAGTIPFSKAEVEFSGASKAIQQPRLSLALGMLFQLH